MTPFPIFLETGFCFTDNQYYCRGRVFRPVSLGNSVLACARYITKNAFREDNAYPFLQPSAQQNSRISHKFPLRENRTFRIYQACGGTRFHRTVFPRAERRSSRRSPCISPWGQAPRKSIFCRMVGSFQCHADNGAGRQLRIYSAVFKLNAVLGGSDTLRRIKIIEVVNIGSENACGSL